MKPMLLLILCSVVVTSAQQTATPAADAPPQAIAPAVDQLAGEIVLRAPLEGGTRYQIKHVNQGKGTAYCATASILMALQNTTGLDLSSADLMPELAGIRSVACGAGKLGNKPDGFCNILNINSRSLYHNIQVIKSREEQQAFARVKLLEEIVPFLASGCVVLVINSERDLSHAILATSFDAKAQQFVIHDPLKQGSELWTLEKLAKHWPRDLNGVMLLRAQLIPRKNLANDFLMLPPESMELNVISSELIKIKFTQALSFPENRLKNEFSDFSICPLHTLWEKGRLASEVKGIATWLKIKVAQGEPACLFYNNDSGERTCVAVSGYRGGYKNFEGEMQITSIGKDGKLAKSWVKSAEVLQMGKSPRECGGDSFYIIYPNKPLAQPTVTETKNTRK